jgi:hypothetical protein
MAAHGQDILRAKHLGLGVRLGSRIWLEDDLNESCAIPQVNEDNASVIAPSVDPAAQDDLLTYMLGTQLTALVGAAQIS